MRKVLRAAAARAITPLVLERNDDYGVGGLAVLAAEVARSSGANVQSVERMLYRILVGKTRRRDGSRYVQRWGNWDSVDLILTGVDRVDLWYSDELRGWAGSQPDAKIAIRTKKIRVDSRLDEKTIRLLHARHLNGESINTIAKDVYGLHGYASVRSCVEALRNAFHRQGFAVRDRVEASRAATTKHGMTTNAAKAAYTLPYKVWRRRSRKRCGETRLVRCDEIIAPGGSRPRQCRRWALNGRTKCFSHDPSTRPLAVQHVLHARTYLDAAA